MNNAHILLIFLVATINIHAMENNQPIDNKTIDQSVKNDYKDYLINQLKEYKNSDGIDMNIPINNHQNLLSKKTSKETRLQNKSGCIITKKNVPKNH